MTASPPLAILGAEPRLREPLQVGQFYWPDWETYQQAAHEIFERRFYTSQRFAGPLVVRFQHLLEEFLGVKHAVVIRNATNGLMIATYALGLQGKVIVPSWTFIGTLQALLWSNCQPVFCDIDPQSQQMSVASVRRLLDRGGIQGILGVHLWGDASPVVELEALAREYGVPLYYDAAHAFGCQVDEGSIGNFGLAQVFSFQAANILSTAEGGCITTNDDTLAAEFTAMRGDEVSEAGMASQSATSRMSEMQAAIGLALLDDYEKNRRNNEEQQQQYRQGLSLVPGIEVLQARGVTRSNHQCLVATVDPREFGLGRDELVAVLRAEHVVAGRQFYPLNHSVDPFDKLPLEPGQLQNTESVAQRTFQLPLGAGVTPDQIEQICDILHEAQASSKLIKPALEPPAVKD